MKTIENQVAVGSKRTQASWIVTVIIFIGLVGSTAGIVYLGNLPVDTFFVALSTWLHTLATIIMIGYFIFTSLIFLPILERQFQPEALRELLEQFSARLRPFFGGSLLIFLVTGSYLMLINGQYLGLGQFFANLWSVLMIVKHVLVLAFLGLAVFSERVFLAKVSQHNPQAMTNFRRALHTNMALGAVILLLTAIAQAITLA